MCGIVGEVRSRLPIDPARLVRARDSLTHRGPDGAGVWVSRDGRVGLAHRRLAIIDPSAAGAQPMTTRDGEVAVTFNGEIYNFIELRAVLEREGARFTTRTDTEVLLQAYRAWGHSCLQRLVGMYAFCLYDARKDIVVLARDRAGEKPLFYVKDETGIAFASELKALLLLRPELRRIEPSALQEYLAWGYVARDRSLMAGVRKLPPGHFAVLDRTSGRLEASSYWTVPLPKEQDQPDPGILVEELEDLLKQSVRAQLVADVPLGVLLSGGLDSSLVTAAAAQVSDRVRTFSVTFPDAPAFDEARHARLVAEHFGTDHTEIPMAQPDASMLEELLAQGDEPIADPSMLPAAALARAVRRDVTVALGGDGGDELFGGYQQYVRLQTAERVRRYLPAPLRRMALVASSALPLGLPGRNAVRSLFDRPGSVGFYNLYFDSRVRRALLPRVRPQTAVDWDRLRDDLAPEAITAGERAARADFLSYLPDEVLVKVDRASMLASLEVRAPFLDHRVVEFAFARVPWELKVRDGVRKGLLRRLARRMLPPQFDIGRKQGFTPPIAAWLRTDLYGLLTAMVDHLTAVGFEGTLLRRLASRPHRHAGRLFLLLVLSNWSRRYDVEF